MAPPRRKVLATAEETMFPPDELADTHQIARAIKATGNNIYLIELPNKKQKLVELPARFRSTFWIKRGSFVVVDTSTQEERDNKIGGEIINIVRDEKAWRKASFWYDTRTTLLQIQLIGVLIYIYSQAQGIPQAVSGRRRLRQ